jgi:predicted secreted hydrolase
MKRRNFIFTPLALVASATRGEVAYPAVVGGTPLAFPRDHGSHPAFRTEWWYITGWVRSADGNDIGIHVTFFRTRPGVAEASASRFAPVQLLFAHAAIADPRHGRLRHDQRAARAGWGLAEANEATTDVRIDDWSLRLAGDTYAARVVARDFAFTLNFAARQPVMLQGEGGISRKGPNAAQASFYYSRPQLAVDGTLSVGGDAQPVRGTAWLDHEWSSAYLAAEARGWDWVGINFDDGGALMAFRIRRADGSGYWTGGTYRDAAGISHVLDPASVRFTPQRRWRSGRTGVEYPVAFRVEAGALDLTLAPLIDDQELDSRASVGTVYWEGAVRALAGNRQVGRGYLELTGYGAALRI